MKTSTIVGVLVALIVILGGWYWWAQNGGPAMPGFSPAGSQACTMEARVCPDGSAVGRTGPNCAFAPCPAAPNTVDTGNTSNQSTPANPAPLGNTGTAADDPGLGDSSVPAGFAAYQSGIKGVVMAGPTCPVMQNPPQAGCEDKPLATTVSVSRAGQSQVFATTKSDARGAFTLSLPPGSYVVSAGEATLPRCNPVSTTVGPQSYVNVSVECDTGIR